MAPSSGCTRCSGFCDFHLNEDNVRFMLLALLMVGYLLCGAAVFSAIEHPTEVENQIKWNRTLLNFSQRFNISPAEFRRFLREYELAMAAGVRTDAMRPRWDFTGAFYFVGTVVSTIGFGMTTPATATGKIFLIFYGMIGCAGTILFFNLFLERIITLLAVIMKAVRQGKLRLNGVYPEITIRAEEESHYQNPWKPSVYNVMLILGLAAVIISFCASSMYSPAEGWDFIDSLYFCFVTFSTIGFGDLVSGQRYTYENQALYGFANFTFILLGVCCIYSLFNVISIIIKQFLNWILKHCCLCQKKAQRPPRPLGRKQRMAVAPASTDRYGRPMRSEVSMDTEAVFESETDARRMSVEMSAIRDFLASSGSMCCQEESTSVPKTSVHEAANGHLKVAWSDHHHNTLTSNIGAGGHGSLPVMEEHDCQKGLLGDIGSLAVMNNKLAETCDHHNYSHGLSVGCTGSSTTNTRLQHDASDHHHHHHHYHHHHHHQNHQHQSKLPSRQGSPISETRSHHRFTVSPDVLQRHTEAGSEMEEQGARSSGVGSLANLESVAQTSGGTSQNGLSSSGIESTTALNHKMEEEDYSKDRGTPVGAETSPALNDTVHPTLNHTQEHGTHKDKNPEKLHLNQSNHKPANSNRTPCKDLQKGGPSNSMDHHKEYVNSATTKNNRFHGSVYLPKDEILSGVGSLTIMNDRFAETIHMRISHCQKNTEPKENA
ncbi:potassium channel subfamily K member 13-like [Erpetoichthys calabaricus]|uniref:potassium channel subfamily K member 13-like n=1 Tax=Erpetoichthys calabaricus TaxID=27687 RepID=UPI002234CB59|nr:potassium channel subfamily K member 13-like [Erpetoichthys calabaricus]